MDDSTKFTKTRLTTAILGFSLVSFHSTAWADTVEQQFQQGVSAFEKGDYQTALKFWRSLAEQGYARAQAMLGLSYITGQGVQENRILAKEWFGKACDNGNQQGCEVYSKLNRGEL